MLEKLLSMNDRYCHIMKAHCSWTKFAWECQRNFLASQFIPNIEEEELISQKTYRSIFFNEIYLNSQGALVIFGHLADLKIRLKRKGYNFCWRNCSCYDNVNRINRIHKPTKEKQVRTGRGGQELLRPPYSIISSSHFHNLTSKAYKE